MKWFKKSDEETKVVDLEEIDENEETEGESKKKGILRPVLIVGGVLGGLALAAGALLFGRKDEDPDFEDYDEDFDPDESEETDEESDGTATDDSEN